MGDELHTGIIYLLCLLGLLNRNLSLKLILTTSLRYYSLSSLNENPTQKKHSCPSSDIYSKKVKLLYEMTNVEVLFELWTTEPDTQDPTGVEFPSKSPDIWVTEHKAAK